MRAIRTAIGRILRSEPAKTGESATIVQANSDETGFLQGGNSGAAGGDKIRIFSPDHSLAVEFQFKWHDGNQFIFIPPGCSAETEEAQVMSVWKLFSKN